MTHTHIDKKNTPHNLSNTTTGAISSGGATASSDMRPKSDRRHGFSFLKSRATPAFCGVTVARWSKSEMCVPIFSFLLLLTCPKREKKNSPGSTEGMLKTFLGQFSEVSHGWRVWQRKELQAYARGVGFKIAYVSLASHWFIIRSGTGLSTGPTCV